MWLKANGSILLCVLSISERHFVFPHFIEENQRPGRLRNLFRVTQW